MQAYRVLDEEGSSALAGVIRDLEGDNTLPTLKSVPGSHRAFLLDPHTVRKEFSSGFRSGFSYAKARDKIYKRERADEDDTIQAKVGKISILGSTGKHRIIAAFVESAEMVAERQAIYSILGAEGLRGFNKKEYRNPGAPLLVLATLLEPVHDRDEREKLEEAVDTAIVIHQASELNFGELQVITR